VNVTIRTVAKYAGVDPSTVSRVLKRGEKSRSKHAEKILAAAQYLNYRPDPLAASLRTGRSRVIGVLMPDVADVVVATAYRAIDEMALSLGYQTLVAPTGDRFDEQIRRAELLISRRVDGLIVMDAHRDRRYVDWLETRKVPFVLVLRGLDSHISVHADDFHGGELVGSHLADQGHRDIVIFAGREWSPAMSNRTAGCVDALRKRGISLRADRIIASDPDALAGREAMRQILVSGEVPSAVFAVNDFAAIGASVAIRERGLHVGTDIALVGYNDIPIAEAFQLTTVRIPLTEMGSVGTRTLVDLIDESQVHGSVLRPKLVRRASSMTPAP
jgi:LacI family transcriptional regulator